MSLQCRAAGSRPPHEQGRVGEPQPNWRCRRGRPRNDYSQHLGGIFGRRSGKGDGVIFRGRDGFDRWGHPMASAECCVCGRKARQRLNDVLQGRLHSCGCLEDREFTNYIGRRVCQMSCRRRRQIFEASKQGQTSGEIAERFKIRPLRTNPAFVIRAVVLREQARLEARSAEEITAISMYADIWGDAEAMSKYKLNVAELRVTKRLAWKVRQQRVARKRLAVEADKFCRGVRDALLERALDRALAALSDLQVSEWCVRRVFTAEEFSLSKRRSKHRWAYEYLRERLPGLEGAERRVADCFLDACQHTIRNRAERRRDYARSGRPPASADSTASSCATSASLSCHP